MKQNTSNLIGFAAICALLYAAAGTKKAKASPFPQPTGAAAEALESDPQMQELLAGIEAQAATEARENGMPPPTQLQIVQKTVALCREYRRQRVEAGGIGPGELADLDRQLERMEEVERLLLGAKGRGYE